MDDPTRHLTEPQPVEPSDAGGYLNPLNVLDLASPTAWINYGIKELTGYDVLESFVKPFSGDWSAYSRYGDALKHLGPAAQDIGVNIQQELDRVDASWEGNANDAAYNYFNNLAAKTSELQHALYAAAAEYEDAARGIWLLAQQVANIIQSVIDEFVIIAAAMAVGHRADRDGRRTDCRLRPGRVADRQGLQPHHQGQHDHPDGRHDRPHTGQLPG